MYRLKLPPCCFEAFIIYNGGCLPLGRTLRESAMVRQKPWKLAVVNGILQFQNIPRSQKCVKMAGALLRFHVAL